MIPTRIFLSLGSSISTSEMTKHQFLDFACEEIQKWGTDFRISKYIESEPWGGVAHNTFVNAVCTLKTELSPEEILDKIHHTEKKAGRNRKIRWEDRPLDIDILLYGDQTINTDTLIIPHKYMWERDFVREPFLEVVNQL